MGRERNQNNDERALWMSSIVWTQVLGQETPECRQERSLVESAKQDPAALAELYRQHYPDIARYIHRRVVDEHEANDIVSEVFLSMVTHLHRYRWCGKPFRIWLYRLATSQLSRWARRRRRWALEELNAETVVDASTLESRRALDFDMVHLVLLSLPLRLQTVMSLHYLEGMKIVEIAGVVRRSPGTVKSRLSEGRKLMCERLKKRGFGNEKR